MSYHQRIKHQYIWHQILCHILQYYIFAYTYIYGQLFMRERVDDIFDTFRCPIRYSSYLWPPCIRFKPIQLEKNVWFGDTQLWIRFPIALSHAQLPYTVLVIRDIFQFGVIQLANGFAIYSAPVWKYISRVHVYIWFGIYLNVTGDVATPELPVWMWFCVSKYLLEIMNGYVTMHAVWFGVLQIQNLFSILQ